MQGEVDRLNDELEKLKEQLSAYEAAQEQEIKNFQETIQNLRYQLIDVIAKNEELEEELGSVAHELDSVSNELIDLLDKHLLLTEDFDSLSSDLDSLNLDLDSLNNELEVHRNKIYWGSISTDADYDSLIEHNVVVMGSVFVRSENDLEKLKNIQAISGDIVLKNTNVSTFSLNRLRTLGGDLLFENNISLNSVELDSLLAVAGGFKLLDNPSISEITLEQLVIIEEEFELRGNEDLDSDNLNAATAVYDFPSLLMIGDDFKIYKTSNLLGLTTPKLTLVGGTFELSETYGLDQFDFSSLSVVSGDISLKSTDISSLAVDLLVKIEGDLMLKNNSELSGFSIAKVTTIEGELEWVDNPNLSLIGMNALETIGKGLKIRLNNNSLSSEESLNYEFPMLKSLGGDLQVKQLNNLVEFKVPALESIDGELVLEQILALEKMDFTSLTSLNGGLKLQNIETDENIGKLDNLDVFNALNEISGDIYIDLPSLTTFSGFSALSSSHDGLNITISNSEDLKELSGFDVLESVYKVDISPKNIDINGGIIDLFAKLKQGHVRILSKQADLDSYTTLSVKSFTEIESGSFTMDLINVSADFEENFFASYTDSLSSNLWTNNSIVDITINKYVSDMDNIGLCTLTNFFNSDLMLELEDEVLFEYQLFDHVIGVELDTDNNPIPTVKYPVDADSPLADENFCL